MPPGERTPLVVGTNLPSGVTLPAQPRNLLLAVERAGQAEGDPDVAVLVEARAEGVLVVVAVDLPAVGDDLEDVGLAVAVGVLDARDVRPLRDVEPAVLLGQAEDLVQAVGEARELGVLRDRPRRRCRSSRFRRGACRRRSCRRAATRCRPASSTSPGGASKRRIL